MTQPIDVAYVDIVVRDKSLKDLRKDVNKTFDDIDKDIGKDLDDIDAKFDKLFQKVDKRFHDLEKSIDGVFEEVLDSTSHLTSQMDRQFSDTDHSIRRSFKNVTNDIDNITDDVEHKFFTPLRRGFQRLGDVIGSIGGVIGQLGGLLTSSPMLALIVALVPAIIALAAALSQLIGLVGVLPAGLSVLVAAIVPVVVAFQNFGDAVSALAEGDVEKIDEALKKLAPSARNVAREVANLLPLLQQFQRGAQEAFFSEVQNGLFKRLLSILPAISQNFNNVAGAMGRFVRQFVGLLTSINVVNALNDVLDATAHIVEAIGPPLFRVFDALAVSVSAGLPFVERLADAMGRVLDRFAAFLNKAIESGAFNEFIEDAITTVKELLDLIKALGGLIGTIFAGTEEAGHDFIQTLTDLTNRMNEFFKSAEGQDVLRDLVFLVKATGVALGSMITSFIFLDRVFRTSLAALVLVGKFFADLGEKIGDFFAQVPAKINEFGSFLATIPSLIGQTISDTIDAAFVLIGTQIGLLLFAVQVLPGKIADFFASLPEKLRGALSSTGPTLLDIFKRALDDAQAFIVAKFNEIVAFVRSVPDRLVALGPIFLQAGKNLITSFMNGFRAVGSFIGDVAGDIVKSVKSFLNRAIDRINSGIAAIDDILPGSLARIPRLAQGALVGRRPGGTLAVVGEGNEDEVVAPLSKLEDIIRKAFGGGSGTTVNFEPGAISVSFSGTTPTADEARAVGRAVGDGIVAQLARRSVTTQLRAV